MDDPLFLHRMQFGFTILFHYIFPALTMGLALLIAALAVAGLAVALRWFFVGLPLVAVYYGFLFRHNRGKAAAAAEGEGY